MRFILITTAALLVTASNSRSAVAGFTAPNAVVGRNLETSISVRLPQAKPQAAVIVTVSSDDPRRLLISDSPEKAGSPKISITIPPNKFQAAPEVWLHGLAGTGSVTYTISAGDMGTAKGKVTLAPSGIVITGPFRAPKFSTTPRSAPAQITVTSAVLDKTGKVIEGQPVGGGSDLEVTIDSSSASAGKLRDPKLVLHGGSSNAATYFDPAGEGEATLIPVQPRGFTAAKQYASVVAVVAKPGIAVVDDVVIGKDLQLVGTLCLGEPAPAGGVEVTITSGDPAKLVFSPGPDVPGSGSAKIKVPEGQLIASISVQALADSGDVTYEAVAPGFRTRVAKVGLARSGVIVAYDPYGPPDEATVLRKSEIADERSFQVSLAEAEKHPVKLVVWTAHLDRENGRAADITVQPLRPGVETTVSLTTSDPAVASVDPELTIKAGSSHAVSRFVPRSKGKTVISIDTPKGFSTPKNATKVPATVTD
jgi:hypothetical protein